MATKATDKFKMNGFDVAKEQNEDNKGPQILQIDKEVTSKVIDYQPQKLMESGQGEYKSVKARFGPLAATDPDRSAKTRKASRFSVNSLLRDPLAIEVEERRVIEEKVRSRISAVFDETKEKALKEGFEAGRQEGHEKAHKEFQAEGKNRLEQFDAFLAASEAAKKEIFRENEKFLIDLIFRIGRMVLLKELQTDKDYLLRLATDLIERVGVRDNIKIRLNPSDIETAASLREGLEKKLGNLQNLHIEPSEEVKGGGCTIETDWNFIDASIDQQLKGIYEAASQSGAARVVED
jgi:flagellar biosynthesis/type III secretory pathway protein FliH